MLRVFDGPRDQKILEYLRYQEGEPYYLCAGTVNGMRLAHSKGLLKKDVPRIIEDYAPKGNPNSHRQSLEEYLVNLLNVKDGNRGRAAAHLHQPALRRLD